MLVCDYCGKEIVLKYPTINIDTFIPKITIDGYLEKVVSATNDPEIKIFCDVHCAESYSFHKKHKCYFCGKEFEGITALQISNLPDKEFCSVKCMEHYDKENAKRNEEKGKNEQIVPLEHAAVYSDYYLASKINELIFAVNNLQENRDYTINVQTMDKEKAMKILNSPEFADKIKEISNDIEKTRRYFIIGK